MSINWWHTIIGRRALYLIYPPALIGGQVNFEVYLIDSSKLPLHNKCPSSQRTLAKPVITVTWTKWHNLATRPLYLVSSAESSHQEFKTHRGYDLSLRVITLFSALFLLSSPLWRLFVNTLLLSEAWVLTGAPDQGLKRPPTQPSPLPPPSLHPSPVPVPN